MFLFVQNAIELSQGILKWQNYFKVDRQAVHRVYDPVVVGLLKKTNVEQPIIAAAKQLHYNAFQSVYSIQPLNPCTRKARRCDY